MTGVLGIAVIAVGVSTTGQRVTGAPRVVTG